MINKRFQSLSFKLTSWYILIIAVFLVIAGFYLYSGFKSSQLEETDKILNKISTNLYNSWVKKRNFPWDQAINFIEHKYNNYKLYIQVIDTPDKTRSNQPRKLYNSTLYKNPLPILLAITYDHIKAEHPEGISMSIDKPDTHNYPIRLHVIPIWRNIFVQVGISLQSTNESLQQLFIILLVAGPTLLIVISFIGILVIRKALIPVHNVVQTAKTISTDDLSLRIQSKERNDEIGELVDTFNEMIARLEGSVNRIRQFSGDVSHELRTPLTIIRGEIEVNLRKNRNKDEYKELLGSILEETGNLEKIIEDLLFLSKNRGIIQQTKNETIRVDDLLLKSLEKREPLLKEKELNVHITKIDPFEMRGITTLIQRMIINVIDNAIHYTPQKGQIHITLDTKTNITRLIIKDTGIGIDAKSLPQIFKRFFVADKSRHKGTGGVGLGLSIVKLIAKNYNIKLNVQSEPKQGTTFTFFFPEQG